MSQTQSKFLKFAAGIAIILGGLAWLAWTGVQESKSYYVKIDQLRALGAGAYTKTLRVEGIVQPGSIKRKGSQADFVIQDSEGGSVQPDHGAAPPALSLFGFLWSAMKRRMRRADVSVAKQSR